VDGLLRRNQVPDQSDAGDWHWFRGGCGNARCSPKARFEALAKDNGCKANQITVCFHERRFESRQTLRENAESPHWKKATSHNRGVGILKLTNLDNSAA
jgi:hypothetical protein